MAGLRSRANSAKNSKKLEALPCLDPCHRNFLLHQSVVQFAGWLTGRQAASLNGWSINIDFGSVMKVIIIDVVLFSTTLLLPAFLATLESFFFRRIQSLLEACSGSNKANSRFSFPPRQYISAGHLTVGPLGQAIYAERYR